MFGRSEDSFHFSVCVSLLLDFCFCSGGGGGVGRRVGGGGWRCIMFIGCTNCSMLACIFSLLTLVSNMLELL